MPAAFTRRPRLRGLKTLRRAAMVKSRAKWQVRGLRRRAIDILARRKTNRLRLQIKTIIASARREGPPSFRAGFQFQQKGIGRDQLLRAGFSMRELKKLGFNSMFMRWMGFRLGDFIREELPISYAESAGFSAGRVRDMYARIYRTRNK